MLLLTLSSFLVIDIVLCKEYIEYHPGDFPLIICSPHDGDLKPSDFADRVTEGCKVNKVCHYPRPSNCQDHSDDCDATTANDMNSQPIAREIYNRFIELKGVKPHLLINNLDRHKLDPNAPIDRGAQGHQHAEDAWRTYHGYLQKAHDEIDSNMPGLILDVHGTKHPANRTELGYLLHSSELNGGTGQVKLTSLRAMGERNGLSVDDLMTGPNSFGALMQESGFAAVPSPDIPYPGNDLYFTGGYTTYTYGSKYGGQVDAIQAETPWGVRCCDDMRMAFAHAVAQDIVTFMEKYYNQ